MQNRTGDRQSHVLNRKVTWPLLLSGGTEGFEQQTPGAAGSECRLPEVKTNGRMKAWQEESGVRIAERCFRREHRFAKIV